MLRPQEGDKLLDHEKQQEYRSGVGMLLYLVKHSRPDLASSVRELTKMMDGATEYHHKEMLRTIKYTLDTKYCALLVQPKGQHISHHWNLQAYCDSDYSGDKDTRLLEIRIALRIQEHNSGVKIGEREREMNSMTSE